MGATGLAQVSELCWQLRNMCDNGRQVPNVRYALAHNVGLGGACCVSVLSLGFPELAKSGTQYDNVNPATSAELPPVVQARL